MRIEEIQLFRKLWVDVYGRIISMQRYVQEWIPSLSPAVCHELESYLQRSRTQYLLGIEHEELPVGKKVLV
jgi:hypothetical protein